MRLRDEVGNETSATATVDVAAPRDVRAPRVSDVFVTPERLDSARAGVLHLTVDEAGRARVVLTKDSRDGERLTVTKDLVAGEQRITLPRLSAGRWDLRVVVTDAAGNASRPGELSLPRRALMRRLLTALVVFLACAPAASAAPRWLDAELPFGEAPALAGPRERGDGA